LGRRRAPKEGAGLAGDREHGKFSRGIKSAVDVTKARAGNLAVNAEWVFGRRAARVLGVVVLFAVVVALLLVFLNWYVAPTKPAEREEGSRLGPGTDPGRHGSALGRLLQ